MAAADGILRIAATKMSHMVRWVTTERGLDAADFALVAYGGAGPLHAAMLARELRIAKVVIPRAPGHFSAYGMLVADLRRDFVNTWFTPLAEASFAGDGGDVRRDGAARPRGRRRAAASRSPVSRVLRAADMRYVGQEHAVTVELPLALFAARDRDGIKRRFDAVHETRYGYRRAAREGRDRQPAQRRHRIAAQARVRADRSGETRRRTGAFRGTRPVYFAETGGHVDTPIWDARGLLAGNRVAGPVLIEEYASTTVVHPGDVVTVDAFGDLVIDILRS